MRRDLGAIRGKGPGTPEQQSIWNSLLGCGLMAVGYLLAGRLGQFLAVPPDYATIVWPASGIALAGMLMAGSRVWPGLFVGAVIVNSWTQLLSSDPIADPVATFAIPIAISAGAVAQAWLGSFLIRRFVGYPSALIEDRLVLGFLALGGPVACLTGATVGVVSLKLGGVIEAGQVGANWLSWWVGDTIGVIIFAPLAIICLGQPRQAWRPRLQTVALPTLAALGAAIIAFVWIRSAEQSNIESRFHVVADNASQRLQEHLLGPLDTLDSVQGFHAGSRTLRRQQFASFSRHLLTRYAGVHAIVWLPRIDQAARDDHELQAQREGQASYQIVERAADGGYRRAAERDELFPVRYREPQSSAEIPIGFDIASVPELRNALMACRDAGRHIAAGPIPITDSPASDAYIFVFAPIYANEDGAASVDERRTLLLGFVAAVLDLGKLVTAAFPNWQESQFDLTIVDPAAAAGQSIVFAPPRRRTGHKANEVAPLLRAGIEPLRGVQLADRRWICRFTPTDAFYLSAANRNTWWVLLCCLVLTAMLVGFLMILSGRRERIEASELRYLDLYEHAPDMFISVDVTTQRVTECNQTFVEATGFAHADIVDRHIYDLFDAESRAEVQRAREQFLDHGKAEDIELRLVCADGRLLDTSMNVLAVRDEHGESVLFRAVLRDITAKKGVEAQMKQQEQEIAHVARLSMMGEMATGLAHEINQPLAAIAAYADGALIRLRDGDPDQSSLVRVLTRIASDAHRAGEVISRLRQFVKNQEPERRDIDVNELVREVAQFVAPDIKRREVKLGLDLHDRLPAVNGDSIQIQQVLLNLVRNGCDAMSDVDPARRRVTIRTRLNGQNEVELGVDDCGRGIPQGVDLKVFEAFFTTKKDGLGLGLAISRSIVESHGGRIWATPNLDGGTSFQFSLPATSGVAKDDSSGSHGISG